MTSLLSGSAFINGAAQGIGLNTAYAFCRHGIEKLALTDVNAAVLEASVKELKAAYPKVKIIHYTVDVRKEDEIQKALQDVVAKFGHLDIAINNAGVRGPTDNTHDVAEVDWANLIDVNLSGIWRCQKAELSVMRNQESKGPREGRGRIVNTASMFGLAAPPRGLPHTAYTSAKHGIVGLTKADAVIYGEHGIRINAICPGFTHSPLLQSLVDHGVATPLARELDRSSMKRAGEPEEIADCIAFLASPLSSFVQGHAMVVDGGFTLA